MTRGCVGGRPSLSDRLGASQNRQPDMICGVSLTDAERETETVAALADAGLEPYQVRLYPMADLGAVDGAGAVWFRPGMTIGDDDAHFRDDALRVAANGVGELNLHRIVVPLHPAERVTFAAMLRHELEHARQFDAAGAGVVDLYDFVTQVLAEVAGGLDGCAGGLINAVPAEIDCNAAASVYISARFPADEVQRLRSGSRWFLACSLFRRSCCCRG